jgi:hypothetical protein
VRAPVCRCEFLDGVSCDCGEEQTVPAHGRQTFMLTVHLADLRSFDAAHLASMDANVLEGALRVGVEWCVAPARARRPSFALRLPIVLCCLCFS